jgi:oligosaccharide repeat unit polymerase
MYIDPARVIRQVFTREQREPPRFGRTSLVIFIAIMAALGVIFAETDGRTNNLYFSIHFAIIGLSLAHIMWVRRFNLALSYSFFSLFFFGIIPLFEYRLGVTYGGAAVPDDSSYIKAALLALMSGVCFYIGYGSQRGHRFSLDLLTRIRMVSARHRQIVIIASCLLILFLGACIVEFYSFNAFKILLRGYGEEEEQSAMAYSLINYVARPLIFNLLFLGALIISRRQHKSWLKILGLCLVAALLVSPIGIPRSLAGALYIPLVMMVFMPRYNSKYTQLCVIIIAILFLAPLADVFRFLNSEHSDVDLGSNFNISYIFAGHFDAFHNLTQVIELKYKSEGWQVIGILLFWVPRDLWEGKPQGTAVDFADYSGFSHENISFPLQAEFYVDYGVIGVLVGMFLTGLLYRKVDAFLSKPQKPGSTSSYLFELSHLEMSILGLYLLRGSVLVSFGYTVGVGSTLVMIAYGDKLLRGFALAEKAWAERRSSAGASALAAGGISPDAATPPTHTPG